MLAKQIVWNEEKNQLLKLQRNVSFELVLDEIEAGNILTRKIHPDSDKYPNQEIFILKINEYIYYVPFVENDTEIFLKTIIPSRKLNKEYTEAKNEK